MNIVYYILYVLLFTINNFLIFHFLILRSFGPNMYKSKWAECVMIGSNTNRKLEVLENNKWKRNKSTFWSQPFTLSFYVKNVNKKLNEKYGIETRINRWKRIGWYWIILSMILIIGFAVSSAIIFNLLFAVNINSILFLWFFLTSVTLIWGTVLLIFLFVFFVFTILMIILFIIFKIRKKEIDILLWKKSEVVKFLLKRTLIALNFNLNFFYSSIDEKKNVITIPFSFFNIFCVSYKIMLFVIIALVYLISAFVVTMI